MYVCASGYWSAGDLPLASFRMPDASGFQTAPTLTSFQSLSTGSTPA